MVTHQTLAGVFCHHMAGNGTGETLQRDHTQTTIKNRTESFIIWNGIIFYIISWTHSYQNPEESDRKVWLWEESTQIESNNSSEYSGDAQYNLNYLHQRKSSRSTVFFVLIYSGYRHIHSHMISFVGNSRHRPWEDVWGTKLGSQPQGHQTLAGGKRWMIAMRKRKRAERHEHI